MIRPAATALTTRVTRTTPSSSSTRTSAKIALCVFFDLCRPAHMSPMPGAAVSCSSITSRSAARIASPNGTRTVGASFRTMQPSSNITSSKPASPSGSPAILPAALTSLLATAWQASCTAAPADAAAHDPPSTGDAGRSESPSRAVICSGGRPSVSAATSVITV